MFNLVLQGEKYVLIHDTENYQLSVSFTKDEQVKADACRMFANSQEQYIDNNAFTFHKVRLDVTKPSGGQKFIAIDNNGNTVYTSSNYNKVAKHIQELENPTTPPVIVSTTCLPSCKPPIVCANNNNYLLLNDTDYNNYTNYITNEKISYKTSEGTKLRIKLDEAEKTAIIDTYINGGYIKDYITTFKNKIDIECQATQTAYKQIYDDNIILGGDESELGSELAQNNKLAENIKYKAVWDKAVFLLHKIITLKNQNDKKGGCITQTPSIVSSSACKNIFWITQPQAHEEEDKYNLMPECKNDVQLELVYKAYSKNELKPTSKLAAHTSVIQKDIWDKLEKTFIDTIQLDESLTDTDKTTLLLNQSISSLISSLDGDIMQDETCGMIMPKKSTDLNMVKDETSGVFNYITLLISKGKGLKKDSDGQKTYEGWENLKTSSDNDTDTGTKKRKIYDLLSKLGCIGVKKKTKEFALTTLNDKINLDLSVDTGKNVYIEAFKDFSESLKIEYGKKLYDELSSPDKYGNSVLGNLILLSEVFSENIADKQIKNKTFFLTWDDIVYNNAKLYNDWLKAKYPKFKLKEKDDTGKSAEKPLNIFGTLREHKLKKIETNIPIIKVGEFPWYHVIQNKDCFGDDFKTEFHDIQAIKDYYKIFNGEDGVYDKLYKNVIKPITDTSGASYKILDILYNEQLINYVDQFAGVIKENVEELKTLYEAVSLSKEERKKIKEYLKAERNTQIRAAKNATISPEEAENATQELSDVMDEIQPLIDMLNSLIMAIVQPQIDLLMQKLQEKMQKMQEGLNSAMDTAKTSIGKVVGTANTQVNKGYSFCDQYGITDAVKNQSLDPAASMAAGMATSAFNSAILEKQQQAATSQSKEEKIASSFGVKLATGTVGLAANVAGSMAADYLTSNTNVLGASMNTGLMATNVGVTALEGTMDAFNGTASAAMAAMDAATLIPQIAVYAIQDMMEKTTPILTGFTLWCATLPVMMATFYAKRLAYWTKEYTNPLSYYLNQFMDDDPVKTDEKKKDEKVEKDKKQYQVEAQNKIAKAQEKVEEISNKVNSKISDITAYIASGPQWLDAQIQSLQEEGLGALENEMNKAKDFILRKTAPKIELTSKRQGMQLAARINYNLEIKAMRKAQKIKENKIKAMAKAKAASEKAIIKLKKLLGA